MSKNDAYLDTKWCVSKKNDAFRHTCLKWLKKCLKCTKCVSKNLRRHMILDTVSKMRVSKIISTTDFHIKICEKTMILDTRPL